MRENHLFIGLTATITLVSTCAAQIPPNVWIKAGEVLIAIVSPLVTDYLKEVIDSVGTKPSADAKSALTNTSEALGEVEASRKTYVDDVVAYIHDLDTRSSHAAESKTIAGTAAEGVMERLTAVANAIHPLNAQKPMFTQSTRDLFAEYRNAKGQNIKELADLAEKSPTERKAFSDRLNETSEMFGEAIEAIRLEIQNKVNR